MMLNEPQGNPRSDKLRPGFTLPSGDRLKLAFSVGQAYAWMQKPRPHRSEELEPKPITREQLKAMVEAQLHRDREEACRSPTGAGQESRLQDNREIENAPGRPPTAPSRRIASFVERAGDTVGVRPSAFAAPQGLSEKKNA